MPPRRASQVSPATDNRQDAALEAFSRVTSGPLSDATRRTRATDFSARVPVAFAPGDEPGKVYTDFRDQ